MANKKMKKDSREIKTEKPTIAKRYHGVNWQHITKMWQKSNQIRHLIYMCANIYFNSISDFIKKEITFKIIE